MAGTAPAQRCAHFIIEDTEVKVHFWNPNWMCIWPLACICISLVCIPFAFAVGHVVHEVSACQTLSIPACGENNSNLQFGTPICRETLFLVFACVNRLAVFPVPLARAFATAVKQNTSLGTTLPRNHLKSWRKRACFSRARTRSAPHIIGRSEVDLLDVI